MSILLGRYVTGGGAFGVDESKAALLKGSKRCGVNAILISSRGNGNG